MTFEIVYRKRFQSKLRYMTIPGCTGPDVAVRTLEEVSRINGFTIGKIVAIRLLNNGAEVTSESQTTKEKTDEERED